MIVLVNAGDGVGQQRRSHRLANTSALLPTGVVGHALRRRAVTAAPAGLLVGVNEPGPTPGSHPVMTPTPPLDPDRRPADGPEQRPEQRPEGRSGRRFERRRGAHSAGHPPVPDPAPEATPDPVLDAAPDGLVDVQPGLTSSAAEQLVQIATTAGQIVLDLDDDPAVRHAATALGRGIGHLLVTSIRPVAPLPRRAARP